MLKIKGIPYKSWSDNMHWQHCTQVGVSWQARLPHQAKKSFRSPMQKRQKRYAGSSISNRKRLYYMEHDSFIILTKLFINRLEILFLISKAVRRMLCNVFTILLVVCTEKHMLITTNNIYHLYSTGALSLLLCTSIKINYSL